MEMDFNFSLREILYASSDWQNDCFRIRESSWIFKTLLHFSVKYLNRVKGQTSGYFPLVQRWKCTDFHICSFQTSGRERKYLIYKWRGSDQQSGESSVAIIRPGVPKLEGKGCVSDSERFAQTTQILKPQRCLKDWWRKWFLGDQQGTTNHLFLSPGLSTVYG